MFLLDTNVASEFRRGERMNTGVRVWLDSVTTRDLAISVITDFELERGVLVMERRDPRQGAHFRRWLTQFRREIGTRILPVTPEVARVCASLSMPNQRPFAESLIAATALNQGLAVATRNVRDFDVPGLSVVNPFA